MGGTFEDRASRIARAAGALVALACSVDIVRIAAGSDPYIPLDAPAHLAALLCAVSLFLTARKGNAAAPWPGRATALAALGCATFAGLPVLLRLGLLAAAASILIRDAPRLGRASEFLAGVTGLSGVALLLALLYGASALRGSVASPWAVLGIGLSLVLLCIGLLAIYRRRGIVALLASDDSGGALVRRLMLPTVAFAIVLGWARLALLRADLISFQAAVVWLVLAGITAAGVTIAWTGRSLDALDRRRRRDAAALRGAEHRFGDLFESARDAIYVHDLRGRFTAVNRSCETLLGYSREELESMNILHVLAPESGVRAAELLFEARGERAPGLRSDDALVVFEAVRKDARHVPIEVSLRVIEEAGRPDRIEGIARDLSERRFLEEQVRQVQRLDAVGLLAGGVAHDLSSHLTTILCYARPLLQRMSERNPTRRDLEQIETAAVSAANLVQQLLAFGRRGVQHRRRLDLNGVLGPIAGLLERQLGHDVETQVSLAPALWPVMADPTQMEQVVMNLALNARDAMPGGGRLTLETNNIELDAEAVSRLRDLAPGRFVLLSVRDTGGGMERETQDRIFDPFFTTKEVGKGTGLGLATVYGIVKQSGGDIAVQSELGHGTTMRVYLPCCEGTA